MVESYDSHTPRLFLTEADNPSVLIRKTGPWLVSGQLLGLSARRHQRHNYNQRVVDFALLFGAVPIIPEQFGGMGRPFPAVECVGGGGEDVLDYIAKVQDKEGKDYTSLFLAGAEETYLLYSVLQCVGAIMHSKSPSCGVKGSGGTHAGLFNGKMRNADGVVSAFLRRKGVPLYTELNLHEIPDYEEAFPRNKFPQYYPPFTYNGRR